jgi:hypothetical protein
MPLDHPRRNLLDGLSVTDVANLVLTIDLRRDGAEALLVASDQDAAPLSLLR